MTVSYNGCIKYVGATEQQILSLQSINTVEFNRSVFNDLEQLCLDLTIQITLHIEVDAELKANLLKLLGTKGFVELVTVISAYNMVSRFLVALDIQIENSS